MEIKVKRIFRFKTELDGRPLKAFADISIDDSILVKGFRVIEGCNGLFVSPPSQQSKDHKWYNVVRFLNEEMSKQIQDIVLEAYDNQEEE